MRPKEVDRSGLERQHHLSGTEGSNPASSSGESANHRFHDCLSLRSIHACGAGCSDIEFFPAGSGYAMIGLFSGARNILLREVVPHRILDAIGRHRVHCAAQMLLRAAASGDDEGPYTRTHWRRKMDSNHRSRT